MELDVPLDIWLPRTVWTHATPHIRLKHCSTYLLTSHCDLHDYNLAAHTFHPSAVCVKTGWRVNLPTPCDMDSFLEMLPLWLLVREWGKIRWQALLYPWWHHHASFSFLWHHHSLFWLADSLSVMPPSGYFLIFVPFLSAERSWVIISSWTPRHTRHVFLFLHWTPYASSLPWPSRAPVRHDTNCWVLLQLVSIPFELAYLLIVWPPSRWFWVVCLNSLDTISCLHYQLRGSVF